MRAGGRGAPLPPSPSPFAGCELNQERPTWTFNPQKAGKQDCVLLLSTVGTPLGGGERGRGGGLGQTRRGRRRCPHAGALGVRRRPAPFPTRSDFPGGESQRRGERRGDPARGQPGRQEEEAPHPGLASGLGPPHGELPRGPRKAWLQPPRPRSGLTLVCRWTRSCGTGPADAQPAPERKSFVV